MHLNDKIEGDMAGKRTEMSKIKQILLLHKDGMSNRKIGERLGQKGQSRVDFPLATGKKIFKVNNVCGMLKSDYYVGSCSI